MKLIFGLGNPGKDYANTRHNVGFLCIDQLADRHHINVDQNKLFGICGSGVIGADKVMLIKPQTYMNESGICVKAFMDYFKVPEEDIIIIQDDIDLEPGRIRVRAKGSAGGHNGLKSILAHTSTTDLARVKIGVGGKPEGWDLADYVLGNLKGDDGDIVRAGIKEAADAVECILVDDIDAAMNRYNKKPKTEINEESKEENN